MAEYTKRRADYQTADLWFSYAEVSEDRWNNIFKNKQSESDEQAKKISTQRED